MKGNNEQTIQLTAFEPTLNSQQAAALLQIHPKTLQKMARQGRVPGHQIGDLWRFRASELDEWLRNEVSSNRHSCRN
jgi:excisionase family DNA binding protein